MKTDERMPEPAGARLLLRAELSAGDATVVTHTVEVGPTQLRLVCDEALTVGTHVGVALSLPGFVPRIPLTCRVAAVQLPDESGGLYAIACDIVAAAEQARATLAQLASGTRPRRAGPYRCLLVEDSAFVREFFAYGVSKYGRRSDGAITIELAEDADAGWRMLEGDAFDMAIVDHHLPTRSGADLIARIRGEARLSNMSVVAISVGGAAARDATIAAGADIFLDKPVVLRELFSTLDKLAEHASPHRGTP